MKFGKNLTRNQVPEWSHSYINYSALKKLIGKVAENEQKEDETADTTEFFYSLDRSLEDVDIFYNKKFADDTRRLKLLNDQYGKTLENPAELDRNEVEDLIGGLLELRDGLRKLQWYGEVNRRGFVKITKKLDKKVPSHTTRQYVESKVDTRPFSSAAETTAMINQINDWLSKASDAKRINDSGTDTTGQALPRVSAKAVLEVSREVLDQIDLCLRNDNVGGLTKLLDEALQGSADVDKDILYQRLQLNLLQRAITCQAMKCIVVLLGNVRNLEEGDDFNQRNCLHRFILSMNRAREADSPSLHPVSELLEDDNYVTPAAPPLLNIPSRSTKELSGDYVPTGEVKSTSLLNFLLDHLSEAQRASLAASDNSGRTPLHYAAQFGFVAIVTIILTRMQDWGQFEHIDDGIDAPFWQDSDGLSPLHLSVIGDHYNTTKALLQAEDWRKPIEPLEAVRKHMGTSGEVLALATKTNTVPIVKLLLEAGVDVNYEDERGETALHVAARNGHVECAAILLEHGTEKANLEIAEKTFGWTPLFIACVDGHQRVVEILLGAGANPMVADVSGWRPSEHATLRGHLKIAEAIVARSATVVDTPEASAASTPRVTSLGDRKSHGVGQPKTTVPVKTFGHRCLSNETMILISLGSMDMRKNVEVVTLDRIPLAAAHKTELDTALSIVVSASGATGEPEIVDLPVQENIATEPIEFMTKNASKVKIMFDIVPTYAGAKDKIVGRGVALLGTVKPNLGSNRISLQGDVSVPIMSSHTLEVIGCVNFNFLVVTPFRHPNISIAEGQTYWKSLAQPLVIGHRGLGKNQASRHTLQLGENTIQSFIAAANLGAQYVEFDVQLTKDHVPVIYHDFLVSETGIDAPVHTLTLEQFMHVSDVRTPRQSLQNSPSLKGVDSAKREQRRGRSLSVGPKGGLNDEMNERMKHTRDFKEKGFKGNSRTFIQAPFATLEEMFNKVPEHVGFNIEVKYPMLHESEEQEMDTYAVEINHFVDTVLKKIFDLNQGRNILMSSFNPDICVLLSLKQPSIPILFLTDAGLEAVGDVRASSLQEAIRFSSRWSLLGIVAAAEPLCLSPRLVQVVKESGLICVSYGTLNNDSKMVKLQVQNGIDAVIVDSVLAIRKGLTESEGVTAKSVQAVVESAVEAGTASPESPPPGLSVLDESAPDVHRDVPTSAAVPRPESSGSPGIAVS